MAVGFNHSKYGSKKIVVCCIQLYFLGKTPLDLKSEAYLFRLCDVQPATHQQALNPDHACKVVMPAQHRAREVAHRQNLKLKG